MNTDKKRGRPAGKSRCECQCVSFLTHDGLKNKLDLLVVAGQIGHYWFVDHEPDEDTKKPHQHLRMTPPVSKAVDWQSVANLVEEYVEGEDLPRKLVLSSKSVNDAGLDGLLYARHDRRYCDAKGLIKSDYDIPRGSFVTDDSDWLDGLWIASDQYEPEQRRLSKRDLVDMIEACGGMIPYRQLLRLSIVNNLSSGDFQMLSKYAMEVRKESQPRKPVVTMIDDERQQDLPF